MFKGKAELVDPEKNTPVATFTETCQSDGTAKMKVVLKAPMRFRVPAGKLFQLHFDEFQRRGPGIGQ
jgi:hypothetical protein